MNAPLLPELLIGADDPLQPCLPLATLEVQRYVWHSAFGAILIEVRDGDIYVNGDRVDPVARTLRSRSP